MLTWPQTDEPAFEIDGQTERSVIVLSVRIEVIK